MPRVSSFLLASLAPLALLCSLRSHPPPLFCARCPQASTRLLGFAEFTVPRIPPDVDHLATDHHVLPVTLVEKLGLADPLADPFSSTASTLSSLSPVTESPAPPPRLRLDYLLVPPALPSHDTLVSTFSSQTLPHTSLSDPTAILNDVAPLPPPPSIRSFSESAEATAFSKVSAFE